MWDWGTWAPAETDDPARRHRARRAALRPARREAGRPVRARPSRRAAAGQGAVAAAPQERRRTRGPAGTRRTTRCRSRAGAPTTRSPPRPRRCGAATCPPPRPPSRWPRPGAGLGPADRRRARRPRRARTGRSVGVAGPRAEAHQPRQGAVPRAGRRSRRSPSATSSATTPPIAPLHAPLPRRPAGQPAPLPRRRGPAGLLAQGGAQPRARLAAALAQRRRRPGRDPSATWSSTACPRWSGWRTSAPWSCTRGRRGSPTCTSRPGRSSTSTRARRAPSTTCWCSPGSTGPRSSTSASPRHAQGHRPARHPDLGPDRARLHVRRDPRAGSRRCRGRSAAPCPSWSAGSGRRTAAAGSPGSTTPRTPSTRRWSPRSAPGPRPARRCRCRSRWDELDDPDLRPDRWTIRTVLDRVRTVGDPLAPLVGRAQELPDLAMLPCVLVGSARASHPHADPGGLPPLRDHHGLGLGYRPGYRRRARPRGMRCRHHLARGSGGRRTHRR